MSNGAEQNRRGWLLGRKSIITTPRSARSVPRHQVEAVERLVGSTGTAIDTEQAEAEVRYVA
jgi:hypothetical protein